jgi:hypothetical protein
MDRNDVVGAWILGSEPYWEVEICDMAIGPDLHPEHYSGIAARYQSRLSTLTGLPDLSQETIKVYSFLRHLIMDKETLAGAQEMGIDWWQSRGTSFQKQQIGRRF